MVDGGGSPELGIYLTRSEIVGRAIVGQEFYELVDEAQQAQDEGIEVLYGRAFDLLSDACMRVQRQPERYDHLIEWKLETTIHGIGHPTIKDALWEAYHELWDSIPWPSSEKTNAKELERRLERRGQDLQRMINGLP